MRPTNMGDPVTTATTWSTRRAPRLPSALPDVGNTSGTTRPPRSRGWRTTRPTRCGCGPRTVGNGPWSLSSVGSTNKEDNALPAFNELPTVTRNVLENADPGLVVGFPVSATDDDNVLPLTYQLHGPDADLVRPAGVDRADTDEERRGLRLRDEAQLNVTMTVSDRQGGSDARAVTISVTDVPEAPSRRPARPFARRRNRARAST